MVFIPQQYGVVTEMYAYVAFLIIFLTFGMETAFFRFTTKEGNDPKKVFATAFAAVSVVGVLFLINAILFAQPIADWLMYPRNTEYVVWFAMIISLDAIASIPLAKLRSQDRAKTFAAINIVNVLVYVGLNIFFLKWVMPFMQNGGTNSFLEIFFTADTGVGYVFIANLIASSIKFLLLLPVLRGFRGIDFGLLKQMLRYSAPLLVAGLAGMINETLDRILLKRMLYDSLGEESTMRSIGIYGACYKISIVISLMIQAFRYAAEPFFFSQAKEKGSRQLYARVMDYFVWAMAATFLFVMFYLDVFKYFIPNEVYWEGLKIVPILLLANVFLGVYYNQSVWYKLTGKTMHGAYLAIFGAVITLVINIAFIPEYNYMASAWATFACYGSMMVASFFLGQKYYPVPYNVVMNGSILVIALLLWGISFYLPETSIIANYSMKAVLMILFLLSTAALVRPTKKVL
ncbi:MAG: O-antigen/teichoic acid export membrane protein [Bacteroidia bacterium]|jgi:O-antigen/teichoic acid export membrane protein